MYLCSNYINATTMDELIKKPGVHTLILLGAIACFIFFQFFYPYHFFYQEQNQLFLGTWEYLLSYLGKPGWLACLTGDFLTQFYYYRFLGPAILTFCILATGYNVRCAIQLAGVKGTWIPYTIACAVMTLLVCFSFDVDYRLCSIFAFMGGANIFRSSTKILTFTQKYLKKLDKMEQEEQATTPSSMTLMHWDSVISIFITVLVCHWLFGNGVWVYGLLVITGCMMYIMQPGTYYRLAALFVPFFLLMLGRLFYFVDYPTLYTYPGLGKLIAPQMELEKDIAADCDYYLGNYNKILSRVDADKDPNKYEKIYYNLVNAQNHNLANCMKKFKDNDLGTFYALDKSTSPLTIHALNELYWVLGDMTICKRAALLGNIDSPGSRNIRMVKRLAEINLVTGDYDAAHKYLYMLRHTFVWKGWANRILACLNNNATLEDRNTFQTYLDKRPFVNTQDTLRLNDDCYTIMRELVESNPANNIAINYMLCHDILKKDFKAFKHDYDAYYLKQKNVAYDPLYLETLKKINSK